MEDIYKKAAMDDIVKSRKKYIDSMKAQGADSGTVNMLLPSKNVGFGENVIYDEMSQVPLLDQLQMMRDYNPEVINKPEETEEESKRRSLRNMFGWKGLA